MDFETKMMLLMDNLSARQIKISLEAVFTEDDFEGDHETLHNAAHAILTGTWAGSPVSCEDRIELALRLNNAHVL